MSHSSAICVVCQRREVDQPQVCTTCYPRIDGALEEIPVLLADVTQLTTEPDARTGYRLVGHLFGCANRIDVMADPVAALLPSGPTGTPGRALASDLRTRTGRGRDAVTADENQIPLWDNPLVVQALTALSCDTIRKIEASVTSQPALPSAKEILDKMAGWRRDVEQLAPTKVLVCTPAGWAAIRDRLAVRYPNTIPTQVPLLFGVQVCLDHDPFEEPWVLVDAEEYYARHRSTAGEAT